MNTWYYEPQSSFIRLYDGAFLFGKMWLEVYIVKVCFTFFGGFYLCYFTF